MRRSASHSTRRPGDDRFPETQWSLILRARDTETVRQRDVWQELIRAYWKPVYATLRRLHGLSIEDAKDATQDFFTMLLDRNFLRNVRQTMGTFRGYLKVSLRNYMTDEARKRMAKKRGGGIVELDVTSVEPFLADPRAPRPEEVFNRQWRRSVLETAGARMEKILAAEEKTVHVRAFRLYLDGQLDDRARLTYEEIACRLGIKTDDVRNYLHRVRKRLQEEVVGVLRETTASDGDLKAELRDLFGS